MFDSMPHQVMAEVYCVCLLSFNSFFPFSFLHTLCLSESIAKFSWLEVQKKHVSTCNTDFSSIVANLVINHEKVEINNILLLKDQTSAKVCL